MQTEHCSSFININYIVRYSELSILVFQRKIITLFFLLTTQQYLRVVPSSWNRTHASKAACKRNNYKAHSRGDGYVYLVICIDDLVR